jgi:Flp pilus assembly pilin Flp
VFFSIFRFSRNEAGTTAMEYGVILGLVGGAILVAIALLYTNMSQPFTVWAEWFSNPSTDMP